MTTPTPAAHYSGMTIDLLQERLAQAEREKAQLVEAVSAIVTALDAGFSPRDILDANSPIMIEVRATLAASAPACKDMPPIITVYRVNGDQWCASSNKSNRVCLPQPTPHAALSVALPEIGCGKPANKDAQDAARYRWLRERHWSKDDIAVVCHPKKSVKLGFDCPSGQRLDEAIDAALAAVQSREAV